jgi:hypothetical protein
MPLPRIPKEDVLAAIEKIGPAQPIDVRKELRQGDSVLIGALMSEFVAEGKLRITATRRGGSPFYYDPTKPERLEVIRQWLNEKDRRTIAMLKEQKVMREDSQDPLVRVGLKNTPDFSMRMEADGVTYWRYFLIPEDDAVKMINGEASTPSARAEVPIETVEKIVEKDVVEKTTVLKDAPERPEKDAAPRAEAQESFDSVQPAKAKTKRVAAPGKPKRGKKKAAEPVLMPDGAVMISPQEWLAHDTLYEKVTMFAADMKIHDARVHKPHYELTCIASIPTPFGAIEAFVHAFNKKFTADDVKAHLPRARELGLPVIILSVDAVPGKVTSAFKGMPNVMFKRLS